MAKVNVQKKGKLNTYKFVGTEEPKGKGYNPFGATGHVNENTQAINALGASVNVRLLPPGKVYPPPGTCGTSLTNTNRDTTNV